jgi:hypothetical protein
LIFNYFYQVENWINMSNGKKKKAQTNEVIVR